MTLEHRMQCACDTAHALLDVERLGVVERERRRDEAFALWDIAALPCAVFALGSRTPERANAAWAELFARYAVPVAVLDAFAEVERSSEIRHLPELVLETGATLSYCAATVRPRRGSLGATDGMIVVCALTTDAVIARKLAMDPAALIFSAQLSGGPTWVNEAWNRYIGTALDSTSWRDVIHADDRARCLHAFAEAGRLRMSSEVEARIRREDGWFRWHWIRFSVDPLGGRWFGTAMDREDEHMALDERTELLTQAHAARADAEQANRLKDQFLAIVSHELRAPMTTMLLWERVLRDPTAEPEVREQALAALHESAVTQTRLVSDLLDVARAISGKLYVDLRPVDLARVCREAVEAVGPGIAAKRLAISMHGTETLVNVQGDAARLRQVLDNLLSNAINFTPEGGRISVDLARRGRRISLEVTDTGRGVAAEFLPYMFEAFSQTDDALTRDRKGLGLGLAIVKQLVELHEGTVTATSAGTGCGTRFTISLPAAAPRTSSPTRTVAPALSLRGVRVLVVDDDPRVRDALELLLSRAGAKVDIASSAEAARTEIAAHAPSVIVCDIAMPGEDGYSFARSLRATGSVLPAIALTAHAMEADAVRAISAGFDQHLAKPIDFDHLVASLLSLLATREYPVPS